MNDIVNDKKGHNIVNDIMNDKRGHNIVNDSLLVKVWNSSLAGTLFNTLNKFTITLGGSFRHLYD